MEEEKLSSETELNKPLNKEEGNANDITVTEALPISYKLPESNTIHAMDNVKLSMEDRKEGWIEQPRKRGNGREDKYYYHLKSDEMCRSLVEVHDFIKHGIPIRVSKKMKKKQQDDSPAKKIRGSSLVKKKIVGHYNLQTKTVSQLEPSQAVEECPQQPLDNLVDPIKETEASCGNKEREGDEYPMKEGECKSEDTSSLAPGDATVPYIIFDLV